MSELKITECQLDEIKTLEIIGEYKAINAYIIKKPEWKCISFNNYSDIAKANLTLDSEYEVAQNVNRFDTHIVIKGHPISVNLKVASIFSEYPPQGYNTRIASLEEIETNVVKIKVVRMNNCD